MKQLEAVITRNEPLTAQVFRLVLESPDMERMKPGQFVNIRPEGLFLRRPISVYDSEEGRLTLVYKTVGKGTAQMSRMKTGEKLDLLTGLGNGYDLSISGEAPLLLGGGVGVPPLYLLAKRLREAGKQVSAVLGFNTAAEVFCEAEFASLGCRVTLVTADGTKGRKGFVTDALPPSYSHYYACGPEAMLRAVYRTAEGSGQFSLEERMGCGFGACMGCTCRTVSGPKRICREGPVLRKEEIVWED